MVTQTNLIFSIPASARIFGVALSQIAGFKLFAKVAWVWIKGRRPKFVSLKVFKAHFVDRRKAESANLKAIYSTLIGGWVVANPDKGTQYCVTATADGIHCACHDCQTQKQFLGKGVCKHGYAVLREIGFSDLRSYLAAQ